MCGCVFVVSSVYVCFRNRPKDIALGSAEYPENTKTHNMRHWHKIAIAITVYYTHTNSVCWMITFIYLFFFSSYVRDELECLLSLLELVQLRKPMFPDTLQQCELLTVSVIWWEHIRLFVCGSDVMFNRRRTMSNGRACSEQCVFPGKETKKETKTTVKVDQPIFEFQFHILA